MSTIQVNGAIEFRFSVTDYELAIKIQQLLKQHSHAVVKPADVKQGGNGNSHGRTNESVQVKHDKILKMLQDKYGTRAFRSGEALADVKQLGYPYDTMKRALKAGIAAGKLASEKKGIYHFFRIGYDTTTGRRTRRIKRRYTLTKDRLAWLRTCLNPLMWWMLNERLKELNDYEADPALIDRTLEFSEALADLSRHPGIKTTESIDATDYTMQQYMEFLEENGESLSALN